MKLLATALLILTTSAEAKDPRPRAEQNRNYILRRQEAYQVRGVPEQRLIIGKREIDVYRNGLMFEGDHMVGVKPR